MLNKLCEGLLKLEPQELPTLAFQLFTLSSTPAQLMIPLISLNQYFQTYLYKKQLDQSPDSEPLNFDSIGECQMIQLLFHSNAIYTNVCILFQADRFSDNDLVSAQNTILYHLSNCSEYKISEKEMVQQFRVSECCVTASLWFWWSNLVPTVIYTTFQIDIGNKSQMYTHAIHVERIVDDLQCEPVFGIGPFGRVKCIAIHSDSYTEQWERSGAVQ